MARLDGFLAIMLKKYQQVSTTVSSFLVIIGKSQ